MENIKGADFFDHNTTKLRFISVPFLSKLLVFLQIVVTIYYHYSPEDSLHLDLCNEGSCSFSLKDRLYGDFNR